MSNEAELILRARAITKEAFDQVKNQLADLERQAKSTGEQSKTMGEGIRSFYQSHQASFTAVGSLAAGTLTAVVGLASGIAALAVHGSGVSDIREAFNQMNATIGNDGPRVLGTLREAFAGTISDFDLMKLSNEAMSKGLKGNEGDFKLVAQAARALGERTGVDAAQAFGTLSAAMATGKTKGAELLIGVVENTKAYQGYAASLHKKVSEMTEAEKAAATQIATQGRLRDIVRETGVVVFDAGDAWAATKVQVDNFKNSLGEAIANSPVLGEALKGIKDGLEQGFGVDRQAQVQNLSSLVGSFAIGLTTGAQVAVTGAGVIARAWSGLQLVFSGTMSVVFYVGLAISTVVTKALELAATIPGVGDRFKGMAATARETTTVLGGMQQSFHDQAVEALEGVKGHSALHDTLGKVNERLGAVKAAMIAAQSTQVQANATTRTGTNLANELAAGLDTEGAAAGATAAKIRGLAAEHKALNDAMHDVTSSLGKSVKGTFDGLLAQRANGISPFADAIDMGALGLGPDSTLNGFEIKPTLNLQSLRDGFSKVTPMAVEMSHPAGDAMSLIFKDSLGKGISGAFAAVGPSMLAAIQGGGSVIEAAGGAFGSYLTGPNGLGSEAIKDALKNSLGKTIGGAVGAMIPMIGPLMGPLIGKFGEWMGKLFGAPSEEELKGRGAADTFHAEVNRMLTDAQRLEAAGDKHKALHIAIRDAVKDRSLSEQEASRLTRALWAAEKEGPEAVKRVIDEINGILTNETPAAVAALGGTVIQTVNAISDTFDQRIGRLKTMLGIGVLGNANYGTGAGDGSPGTGGASNVSLLDYLAANPGDIHRYAESQTNLNQYGENITDPELLAASRNRYDNEARNYLADQATAMETLKNILDANPELEGYATGGVVDAPMSGRAVNVHGLEAIIPLDRPSAIGDAFASHASAASRGVVEGALKRMEAIAERNEAVVRRLAYEMALMPGKIERSLRYEALLAGVR